MRHENFIIVLFHIIWVEMLLIERMAFSHLRVNSLSGFWLFNVVVDRFTFTAFGWAMFLDDLLGWFLLNLLGFLSFLHLFSFDFWSWSLSIQPFIVTRLKNWFWSRLISVVQILIVLNFLIRFRSWSWCRFTYRLRVKVQIMIVLTWRCTESCRFNNMIVIGKMPLQSCRLIFSVLYVALNVPGLYFFWFFRRLGLFLLLNEFRWLWGGFGDFKEILFFGFIFGCGVVFFLGFFFNF